MVFEATSILYLCNISCFYLYRSWAVSHPPYFGQFSALIVAIIVYCILSVTYAFLISSKTVVVIKVDAVVVILVIHWRSWRGICCLFVWLLRMKEAEETYLESIGKNHYLWQPSGVIPWWTMQKISAMLDCSLQLNCSQWSTFCVRPRSTKPTVV